MIDKIVLEHFGGRNAIICRTAREMQYYKSELERKFTLSWVESVDIQEQKQSSKM